jgi:hypothetical protein
MVEVFLGDLDRITSRIAVIPVRARRSGLVAVPRRVRVRVGDRESDVIEIGGQRFEANLQVHWLDFLAPPPPNVTIALLDADTGEVLDRRNVQVHLAI